ncbi:MAG TPA: ATP-grasp domain-containing protein [Bacteroidales bacterium]|nr:ATP-grasp domain-containing protein [Bacteroidales bacterium]HPS17031.1 ATP-grasp domain-containing protein [Bacteroidales bacterium]
MKKKILILYSEVFPDSKQDELDVLEQVDVVRDALKEKEYEVLQMPASLKLDELIEKINEIKPDVIFNLVETIQHTGEILYIVPALLQHLHIPYTGSPIEALFITTSKVLTKKMMRWNGIPTADWFEMDQLHLLDPKKRYILKPIWEDGSLGIEEENVFYGNNANYIKGLAKYPARKYFIEEYIDGREFNISVWEGMTEPDVLPHAEMQFFDYPEGKPKIMGFSGKWVEGAFEYENTARTFEVKEEDIELHRNIDKVARDCWNVFKLQGYARVDMRVDKNGNIYVLEVNANPCIAENSGFYAASLKAGYSFPDVVHRIVERAVI